MGLFQTVLEKAGRWRSDDYAGISTGVATTEVLSGAALPPIPFPQPAEQLDASLEELWTQLSVTDSGEPSGQRGLYFFTHWHEPAGATTLTLLLAAKAATLDPDLSFCVVDLDLQKRSLSRLLGVERCAGVSEIINHDAVLETCLVPTRCENIAVLPAGTGWGGRARVLRREHARALVHMLAERFQYVLADMPALKTNPAALVWASGRGHAVLVLPAGQIKCESVERALKALRRSQVQIAGLVLNKQHFPLPRWLYRWT